MTTASYSFTSCWVRSCSAASSCRKCARGRGGAEGGAAGAEPGVEGREVGRPARAHARTDSAEYASPIEPEM